MYLSLIVGGSQSQRRRCTQRQYFYHIELIFSLKLQQPTSELLLAFFSNRGQVQNHSYGYKFSFTCK